MSPSNGACWRTVKEALPMPADLLTQHSLPRAGVRCAPPRLARGRCIFDLDVPEDAALVWPDTLEINKALQRRHEHVRGHPWFSEHAPSVGIGLPFAASIHRRAETGEMLIALAQQATLAIEHTARRVQRKRRPVLVERKPDRRIFTRPPQAFTGILMQLAATENPRPVRAAQ